ncbi:MAG TPA: DUF459 domain-containing protein [Gaiellaceae bacterium]|nr:DUF459 domain-containing protein [Gaiellaceae bacterium]
MIAAYKGIVVLALALFLAAILQAEGLRKQAEIQPSGFQRDVALRVTKPLVSFSRALHLTTPRHELQVAIGRENEDQIDTQVHLSLPPPATTPPTTNKPKPRRPLTKQAKPLFTAAHPLRVWVAGDSLAQVPGDALERIGGAIDVVGVESRLSTGLARTDLYNWFTRIQQAPRQLHPDVVVFSFGADDAHDYMGGAHVGPFGSPSWIAEYRRRIDGVTRELNAEGIRVVWLGLPIPDGPGFRKSFPVVNAILEDVAHAHAHATSYVDTWHRLDDFHGRYAQYLRVHGKLTQVRAADGVHYTEAGGDLVAAQVVAQLRAWYRLRS